MRTAAAVLALAALPPVLAGASAAAALLAPAALPPVWTFIRAAHAWHVGGKTHYNRGQMTLSPRPAVRVDPGHGPGEVSPDPGPTPGQPRAP